MTEPHRVYIDISKDKSWYDSIINVVATRMSTNPKIEMVDNVQSAQSYFIWPKNYAPRISINHKQCGNASETNFYEFYVQLFNHLDLFNKMDVAQSINLIKLSNSTDENCRKLAVDILINISPCLLTVFCIFLINRHKNKDKDMGQKISMMNYMHRSSISTYIENKLIENWGGGLSVDNYYQIIKYAHDYKNNDLLNIFADKLIQNMFFEKYSRYLKIENISIIGFNDDQIQPSNNQPETSKEFWV